MSGDTHESSSWVTATKVSNLPGNSLLEYLRCRYLSYDPPAYECGTRPFLRWVRWQDRSPYSSGSSKNASGPVGIPFFGAPQAPGDKLNPSEEGKNLGNGPPEARGTSSADRTARHDTASRNVTQTPERVTFVKKRARR